MSEQFDKPVTQSQFNEFRIEIHDRFKSVDGRFEQVDQRFEQVDHRLEQIDKRFDKVDLEIRELRIVHEDLRTDLNKVLDVVLDTNRRIARNDKLAATVENHENRISALENNVESRGV